jgi:hypothetical protein
VEEPIENGRSDGYVELRAHPIMKILLQDMRTGLYFRSLDAWTNSIVDAHDFKFSEKAIAYAVEHHIPDVQIVMVFRESGHVETVPFPKQLSSSFSHLPR